MRHGGVRKRVKEENEVGNWQGKTFKKQGKKIRVTTGMPRRK